MGKNRMEKGRKEGEKEKGRGMDMEDEESDPKYHATCWELHAEGCRCRT